MNSNQPLTEHQAASFLQLSPNTLRQWRSRKCGPPYIKLGAGSIRYLMADLESWVLSQERVG